jgi:hypothetical protein
LFKHKSFFYTIWYQIVFGLFLCVWLKNILSGRVYHLMIFVVIYWTYFTEKYYSRLPSILHTYLLLRQLITSQSISSISWHNICFFQFLYSLVQFFSSDFQLFRPEYHWRDLSSRNAHLVHQNWYRISFTF